MMLATLTFAAALAAATPAAAPPLQAQPSVVSSDAQSHIDAGMAAYKRRRLQEAQRHFQAAVDADPQSAAAHYYLGYVVYKIAEPKRPFHPEKQVAAQHFAKAYELDPTFRPAW
jgi:tetratricopeptide (TPR) repeat protein